VHVRVIFKLLKIDVEGRSAVEIKLTHCPVFMIAKSFQSFRHIFPHFRYNVPWLVTLRLKDKEPL